MFPDCSQTVPRGLDFEDFPRVLGRLGRVLERKWGRVRFAQNAETAELQPIIWFGVAVLQFQNTLLKGQKYTLYL